MSVVYVSVTHIIEKRREKKEGRGLRGAWASGQGIAPQVQIGANWQGNH